MQAIIDIGSNSVRLMLWADGKTLYKRVHTTRLGEGIALRPVLLPEAIERTAAAVAAYAEEGRRAGAEVHAFATAAVRTAANGADFCARVRELCGVRTDVVSGEEEALLGLEGATAGGDGGIIDIGGASTEVCVRRGGKIVYSRSLPVGAVRLYDLCGDRREALLPAIGEALGPLRFGALPSDRFYAIGGTGSTLASVLLGLGRYDAEKIQDLRMPREEIAALADKLLSLTAEERRALRGMDEKRADIIAGGALLLWKVMEKLSLAEVCASDRDNLEGYLKLRGLG